MQLKSYFPTHFCLFLILLANPMGGSLLNAQTESEPLILLWEATDTPDDIIVNANFIALDTEGNCYVSSGAGYPVRKFDPEGNMVATFGTRGSGDGQMTFGTGVAVDSLGNVYVADFVDKPRILKYDKDGNFVLQWATEPPTGPTGLAVDTEDHIFVANHRTHDHYIQKFDGEGNLLDQWAIGTGSAEGEIGAAARIGIEAIAIDQQDNLYISDPVNNRIQKFDKEGKFLRAFGQFDLPFGVAVDKEDNIYVTDRVSLTKLDPDGNILNQWATRGLEAGDLIGARFVAVDGNGDIFTIASSQVVIDSETFDITVLKKFQQP